MALAVLILSFSNRLFRENYIQTEKERLWHLAELLQDEAGEKIKSGTLRNQDLLNWKMSSDIRFTVIRNDGLILGDTEKAPATMNNHSDRPEIIQALKEKKGYSIRYSSTLQAEMLYVAIALGHSGHSDGVLRVSHYLENINTLASELTNALIRATGTVIIIALFIMYLVIRRITTPLRELKKAVEHFEEGKFAFQFSSSSNDEITELARHFESMARKVNDLFQNLSRQAQELTRIVDSIGDGLVVLSNRGEIIHSNRKFESILGRPIRENKNFKEEIPSKELISFLNQATEKPGEMQKEIDIRGKTILAVSGFIDTIRRYVVILHDITELKNLEQIKKDLIANVSHELRTPLTAMKGYLEIMEEDLKEPSLKYLNIIQRHTERMINIVGDLLILSELENDKARKITEKVDLQELITDVVHVLTPRAKEKNLFIKIEEKSDVPVLISGDSFRLEQALINLAENAIKYTETGGVIFHIESNHKPAPEALITIEDTGPGIAPEHIPRLFERFYVVDKSRSRKLGGTGLGLSIVKHIVSQHHGKIEVKSRPGTGTRFILFFPLIKDKN